jgi:hypothetical protein
MRGGCGPGIGGEGCGLVHVPNNTTASNAYSMYGGDPAVFPASFTDVPIRSFYGQNDYNNDPIALGVASRNIPQMNGGKKRKPKMKGGAGFYNNWGSSYMSSTPTTLYNQGNLPLA